MSVRIRLPLLLVWLVLTGALALASGGAHGALLDLLPLVFLVATMLIWPYPAAELLVGRLFRRSSRPRKAAQPKRRSPAVIRRGGWLISLSLGGRAPPAAVSRCHATLQPF